MTIYHFNHVHAGLWLGIEQCSIWHRFLVPDLHDTHPRTWRRTNGSLFSALVSGACVVYNFDFCLASVIISAITKADTVGSVN